MRASRYLLATLKETPADADTASHRLMLRAGLVRQLASGLYTWLPLGMRVLHKVTAIVRQEMDRSGALEVNMPVVQPAGLWRESGRWEDMGPELLRFRDRHDRDFCLGPTHEEVITEMVRGEYGSYRQLPVNLYQIQTKFRDERRPRFGVMRAREFVMKDAYSFHLDEASLEETYRLMHRAYSAIFTRLGFEFRAVLADSGSIGGSTSHEFHVLAESGEDEIVFSDGGDYAANIELARGVLPDAPDEAPAGKSRTAETGAARSAGEVAEALGSDASKVVKTLLVHAADESGGRSGELVMLLLRGDQELSERKAEKLPGVLSPLSFADADEVERAIGSPPGCIGPLAGLSMRRVADHSVTGMRNFICGANQAGRHLVGANWESDCGYDEAADLRKARAGDLAPDGKGRLVVRRGIEVGHIFQLGRKYSEAMGAAVLDENGRSTVMTMGCYGIGITRIVAACIEQNHDEAGIIWPEPVAPFQLIIVPVDAHRSGDVLAFSESLYRNMSDRGVETLLDDRDRKTSPGVKLAESELIGIPHRVVVSARGLAEGAVEYAARRDGRKRTVEADAVGAFLLERIAPEDGRATGS